MAKNGGARPGAGRPLGSKNRLAFRDYWSEEEIAEYVEFNKSNYMGDMNVNKWVGDQLFGKAVQQVEGNLTGTLTITFDNAFTSSSEESR